MDDLWIELLENPLENRNMTLFEALAPGRLLMARRSADGGLRLADRRRRPRWSRKALRVNGWDAKKGRLP